ncbi:MAG: metal-sulfur cluster assembly factor [Burkholderiales bacterium]
MNALAVDDAPFPYAGPEAWREPIARALQAVVDPELALSIVDVGLVYGVTVGADHVHVLLTMTSAACPVTDLIVEDVESELDRALPADLQIRVELTWTPAWTSDRMTESAKCFMGW